MAEADNKTCTKCGELKPLRLFRRQGKYRTSRCKECLNDQQVGQYAALTPEKRGEYAETARVKKYGINNEQLIDLMLKQDFRCAICSDPMAKMNIDHDHDDGHVRGLLCTNCNTAIGKLGDNLPGVMRAVRYLESA